MENAESRLSGGALCTYQRGWWQGYHDMGHERRPTGGRLDAAYQHGYADGWRFRAAEASGLDEAGKRVQIWANGKGMIRLLFEGKVVGFAADMRAALVKRDVLQQQLAPQGGG